MRVTRRSVGWMLVLYGVLGLALVVSGALMGLEAADRIERLSGDADAAIASAAAATEAAADSFANVEVSLADARASADAAAALARDASGTLTALATAMSLSVFGAQPLLPLAEDFTTSAGQAAELAETLDSVGRSLGDTRADAVRIGPPLERLSDELEALGAGGAAGSESPPLRLFVILLVAWLLLQAFGSLAAGLLLLRPDVDSPS